MEPNHARRVVFQAAVVWVVVPMVRVLAFLSLFALNLAVGAAIDAVQSPSVPFGDPNASSPVTGLRLGLAAALVLLFPLVVRSRMPDLAKAVLLAAPVGVPTAALLVTLCGSPGIVEGPYAASRTRAAFS